MMNAEDDNEKIILAVEHKFKSLSANSKLNKTSSDTKHPTLKIANSESIDKNFLSTESFQIEFVGSLAALKLLLFSDVKTLNLPLIGARLTGATIKK
ncbi:hypothetical protein ALT761_03339 [Alteromonas sp. 76-1]|uniref:hypothetical protein n=1 Tax=Alteromonas sp. 76-1 TaxID=2358187 RepID=UPI000FD17E02|nr:hypothetical protein [Alteromonas sp. 76-1]VEL98321.1 hypothetical protein ALT761_03339 [Alteromonas sp. 76-1]